MNRAIRKEPSLPLRYRRFETDQDDLAPGRIAAYVPRAGAGHLLLGAVAWGGAAGAVGVGLGVVPVPATLEPWADSTLAGLSIAAALVMLGAALAWAGVRGLRFRGRRRAARRSGAPPWVCDYDWNPGGIRDRARAPLGNAIAAMAVLSLALLAAASWAMDERTRAWGVLLALAVIASALLAASLRALAAWRRYRRHGHAELAFDRFPFHPGDRLSVRFMPNRYLGSRFTLRYVEPAGPDDPMAQSTMVARHTQRFQPVLSALSRWVQIDVEIPDNSRWVTALGDRKGFRYWELRLDADVRGGHYQTTFPLPVYARPRQAQASAPGPDPEV